MSGYRYKYRCILGTGVSGYRYTFVVFCGSGGSWFRCADHSDVSGLKCVVVQVGQAVFDSA